MVYDTVIYFVNYNNFFLFLLNTLFYDSEIFSFYSDFKHTYMQIHHAYTHTYVHLYTLAFNRFEFSRIIRTGLRTINNYFENIATKKNKDNIIIYDYNFCITYFSSFFFYLFFRAQNDTIRIFWIYIYSEIRVYHNKTDNNNGVRS